MRALTPSPESVDARGQVTRATVMFADVVGFSDLAEKIGPEGAYSAVTGAVKILDGIARRHGGSVDKYLGDCVMVVFGHPVPTADAAGAAAAAALEMREQFREYRRGLDVAAVLGLVVGINTGAMVAGDIRGGAIREFHVLGDTVNVAARLKAQAPRGAIYVGPETHDETKNTFEYELLGRVRLKGKTADVPIFELIASHERRSGTGSGVKRIASFPLIGRASEIGLLATQLAALAMGRGGVLLIVGEEGIGKSRLVAEAETLPAAQQATIIHARTGAGSRARPGALLADLLLACESDTGGASAAPAAVAHRLVERLRARAVDHLVVVLEDLHEADPDSLALLPDVVTRLREHAVLFLLTVRPEGPYERLRGALPPSSHDEIRLGPLASDEAGRLVDAVAVDAMSDDSRQMIIARALGNPARLVSGTYLEPALRTERERTRPARRQDDTERRRATILFADITGFTSLTERAGAERAYPVVVGCLRLLDDIACKHGGTVEKYLGDCVMALFGVPEAIEDAPRAAVNAAIEMRRRVRAYSESVGAEMRLDVHSGINTGLGIAGDISGPLIREFAVMGDPVSVADELKDLAPAGHVYVGLDVYRATREVFEYRELEASARKGRGTPVRVFELLSEQERLHRARIGSERRVFSTLVGREDELAHAARHAGSPPRGTGRHREHFRRGGPR